MQEQESDGLLIENNPIVADIQTIDSLVQHTTDGKKVICLAHFFATNMNKKSFLVIVDTNARRLEPIQQDAIGASSAVPLLQIEVTTEKVPYPFSLFILL